MAFNKKIWVDRASEYPSRRKLTNTTTQEVQTVNVERAEGQIITAGDEFNATTMNDLETRIYNSTRIIDETGWTLLTTDWEATPSDDYFYGVEACAYKCDIALTGITSNSSADVIFHPSSDITDIAMVTNCINGYVRIYASETPSESIEIIQINYIIGG